METVQRLIGTCQICEGTFKLDSVAHMVHHGYKRPGHGEIVGDCSAVGHPAYEQSCELLKSYTQGLRNHLQNGREYLRRLEAGEVLELHELARVGRGKHEARTHRVGDPRWESMLQAKIREQKRKNDWLTQDIARQEARIASWKPLPIRTIQEAEAEKRAGREAAKATREAKKAAKLQAKLEGYQKRLDTAVRRHTTSTIAEIFESAPMKLREIAGYDVLTAAQALALLERDPLWAAFGLDTQDPRSEANRRILSKMSFPEFHGMKACPWPTGI